jgi:hypothetical protein
MEAWNSVKIKRSWRLSFEGWLPPMVERCSYFDVPVDALLPVLKLGVPEKLFVDLKSEGETE